MKLAVAVALVIFISGCVQSANQANITIIEEPKFPNRAASIVLGKLGLATKWILTDQNEEKINASGFESGYKIRLSRAEDTSRITARIIIYTFRSNEDALAYYESASENGNIDLGLDNCLTTQSLSPDLEITKASCIRKDVFYRIDVTGDGYENTENDLLEIADAVENRITK